MLPFGIVETGVDDVPSPVLLLGEDEDGLVGFNTSGSFDVWTFDPEDILGVVNTDPAAVFFGTSLRAAALPTRKVANKARRRLPRFVARGQDFPVLGEGVLSGYPVAAAKLRKHREEIPSVDTIAVSAIFAVSTVRTRIEQAELAYACFGELYRKRSRTMPPVHELRRCFTGLQNTKSAMFSSVADYAPTIQQAIGMGYRDRELRSLLALDTTLPEGLGLAKLSFTLALLGHDTICLDARLMRTMFPRRADYTRFEQATRKEGGRVGEHALLTYEAAEDAFLAGNRYYDPRDPLGRARAQWMSWEAVGGKGATHSVWLEMLPEAS